MQDLRRRRRATTDLSVADPAWLASYVVLCVALLVVLVRSGVDRRGGLSLAIDGTTVVAVSVLVTWTLAIGRFVNATAAPAHVRLVWAAYPLLQAVLLALVLMAMIVPRARRMLGPGFAIGVGFWLTTNIIYIHAPSEGGYVAAGASWMVAVVLMARTAWLGEAGTAEGGTRPPGAPGWRPRRRRAARLRSRPRSRCCRTRCRARATRTCWPSAPPC